MAAAPSSVTAAGQLPAFAATALSPAGSTSRTRATTAAVWLLVAVTTKRTGLPVKTVSVTSWVPDSLSMAMNFLSTTGGVTSSGADCACAAANGVNASQKAIPRAKAMAAAQANKDR